MKRIPLWAGSTLAGLAVGLMAPAVLVGALAAAAGIGAIAWVGRCRHGGPLGLLPPTVGEDGARTPARWYCDTCGRSWPAGLDRDHQPIVRFKGYDQSKLPASARRAALLSRQRQANAVRRAGLAVRRTAAPAAANVTSITKRRAG